MSERIVIHLTRGLLREQGDDATARVISFEDAEGLIDAIASLAPAPVHSQGMLVVVEPPLLQRRTLRDMPPVRAAALQELVAQGTARFFRQNGHALLSSAAWSHDDEGKERVVRAVAVEEIFAEAIVAGAARGGFQLEDIIAAGPSEKPLSLLPVAERQKRAAWKWRRIGVAAVGVLLVAMILGGVLLVQTRSERRRVEERLATLKLPMSELSAMRLAMDSALVAVLALQAAESQRMTVASRLYDAGRLLPDSAWLTSLTLDRIGTGNVEGRAMQAVEVEAQFGAMRAFAPVRLSSSGASEPIAGRSWERFTLGLGVEEKE